MTVLKETTGCTSCDTEYVLMHPKNVLKLIKEILYSLNGDQYRLDDQVQSHYLNFLQQGLLNRLHELVKERADTNNPVTDKEIKSALQECFPKPPKVVIEGWDKPEDTNIAVAKSDSWDW